MSRQFFSFINFRSNSHQYWTNSPTAAKYWSWIQNMISTIRLAPGLLLYELLKGLQRRWNTWTSIETLFSSFPENYPRQQSPRVRVLWLRLWRDVELEIMKKRRVGGYQDQRGESSITSPPPGHPPLPASLTQIHYAATDQLCWRSPENIKDTPPNFLLIQKRLMNNIVCKLLCHRLSLVIFVTREELFTDSARF